MDRTAEVLPLLPSDAQDYARKWLESKGLDLRLGQELPLERQQLLQALGMEAEQTLVLPCAGVRFPGGGLVAKLGAGDSTGQICTNRAMQCVCEGGKKQKGNVGKRLNDDLCLNGFLHSLLFLHSHQLMLSNSRPVSPFYLIPPFSKIDNVVTSSYIS